MTNDAHTKDVMLKAKLHACLGCREEAIATQWSFVASCSLIAPAILNVTLRVHW